MYIVGLTGGIGSGKTAASDYFQTLGIDVVDADICARIVVQKGQPALAQIQQHFGDAILHADGELNRAALRAIVFQQPEKKHWLESLLHPLIAQELNRQLEQATSPYVLLVSPLLIESKQYLYCDRVIVVDVQTNLQVSRASQRDNNSPAQIESIIAQQTGRETRLSFAHDVLNNEQDRAHLHQQIDQLHAQYLTLAQQKKASHAISMS